MKHIINSICCRLNTATEAARDKHNAWGVRLFEPMSARDLQEIWYAARDLYEAVDAALERADDEKRLQDHCGPKGDAA
jgi:hypothetical protein